MKFLKYMIICLTLHTVEAMQFFQSSAEEDMTIGEMEIDEEFIKSSGPQILLPIIACFNDHTDRLVRERSEKAAMPVLDKKKSRRRSLDSESNSPHKKIKKLSHVPPANQESSSYKLVQ